MNPMEWIVTYGCKLGMHIAYRIETKEFEKIQWEGPLIAFGNHRGLVEAPIIYTSLKPRPKVTALAKIEMWDNAFLGWVFKLWKIIPVRRGEADMEALRRCLEALKEGNILGIAPEGTRSKSGALIKAHPGITLLALHSGAPIQPIAQWCESKLLESLKKFRRPVFHFRVGAAFRLDSGGKTVTKEIRARMAEEIMYQLAILLPEKYRGEYSDIENATTEWLRFV
jgi:1-acyl-sn-glycerol-3-phosphate acyltransferase